MFSVKMNPTRSEKKRMKPHGSKNESKDFHVLTFQILELANQGLSRTDFQREVSKKIIAFFGCDSVEFWLKDHEKYYQSPEYISAC